MSQSGITLQSTQQEPVEPTRSNFHIALTICSEAYHQLPGSVLAQLDSLCSLLAAVVCLWLSKNSQSDTLAVLKPRQFQQTWGRERQGFFLQIPRDVTASILASLITNISIFGPKMFWALSKSDTAFYSKTPWHQAAPQARSLLATTVYISCSSDHNSSDSLNLSPNLKTSFLFFKKKKPLD